MTVREKWFLPYERSRGRMHVCLHAYCRCDDCQTSPQLRLLTALDRSDSESKQKVRGAQ